MKLNAVTLLFLLAVGSPHDAYAHITGGLTKDIGQYRIQFISEPKFPIQSERITLFFNIQNATNGIDLYNQTVSVTIMKDGQIIKTIPQYDAKYANVLMNHTFTDAGLYSVSIEVTSAPVPVKADFPVEVSSRSIDTYVFALMIAAAIGTAVVVIIFRKKATSG